MTSTWDAEHMTGDPRWYNSLPGWKSAGDLAGMFSQILRKKDVDLLHLLTHKLPTPSSIQTDQPLMFLTWDSDVFWLRFIKILMSQKVHSNFYHRRKVLQCSYPLLIPRRFRLSFIFNIHMGVGDPYNTLDGTFFFVHNWVKLEIFHHG